MTKRYLVEIKKDLMHINGIYVHIPSKKDEFTPLEFDSFDLAEQWVMSQQYNIYTITTIYKP